MKTKNYISSTKEKKPKKKRNCKYPLCRHNGISLIYNSLCDFCFQNNKVLDLKILKLYHVNRVTNESAQKDFIQQVVKHLKCNVRHRFSNQWSFMHIFHEDEPIGCFYVNNHKLLLIIKRYIDIPTQIFPQFEMIKNINTVLLHEKHRRLHKNTLIGHLYIQIIFNDQSELKFCTNRGCPKFRTSDTSDESLVIEPISNISYLSASISEVIIPNNDNQHYIELGLNNHKYSICIQRLINAPSQSIYVLNLDDNNNDNNNNNNNMYMNISNNQSFNIIQVATHQKEFILQVKSGKISFSLPVKITVPARKHLSIDMDTVLHYDNNEVLTGQSLNTEPNSSQSCNIIDICDDMKTYENTRFTHEFSSQSLDTDSKYSPSNYSMNIISSDSSNMRVPEFSSQSLNNESIFSADHSFPSSSQSSNLIDPDFSSQNLDIFSSTDDINTYGTNSLSNHTLNIERQYSNQSLHSVDEMDITDEKANPKSELVTIFKHSCDIGPHSIKIDTPFETLDEKIVKQNNNNNNNKRGHNNDLNGHIKKRQCSVDDFDNYWLYKKT